MRYKIHCDVGQIEQAATVLQNYGHVTRVLKTIGVVELRPGTPKSMILELPFVNTVEEEE